jgi:HlyD family secretion protein
MSSVGKPARPLWRIGKTLLLLLLVLGSGLVLRRMWPKRPIKLHATSASVGTVREVVSSATAGEVTPERRVLLRAEVPGPVVSILKKRGDRVTKNELLVRIDPRDPELKVKQAQAALSTVDAQIQQAAARVETLKQQAERAQKLFSGGAATEQIKDDAASALREATQALLTAKSQKEQANAQLSAAQLARTRTEIRAPFAGLLTDVPVEAGDTVSLGSPLLTLIDDTRLHVDATIDEADIRKVAPGQPAELHLDALPHKNILGKVARRDPTVKRDLKGTRTLTVEVEVANLPQSKQEGLLPGMSANVEILVAEKTNVLKVPTNLIVGRGLSRFVYSLKPEGKAYRVLKQTLEIGLSNFDDSEVLSGLSQGDLIVSSLNEKGLEEGALVELLSKDSSKLPP